MIDFSLGWLHKLFSPHAVADNEYVIFGSAVLYLHGIRDVNSVHDLDVFVSPRVWGALMGDKAATGMTVETPRAGDPPFLEYKIDTPIHFFYAWTPRDAEWITAEECFSTAEIIYRPLLDFGGLRSKSEWRCTSLETIRKHKTKAYSMNVGSARHEKHARDLELIDQHLAAE